MSKAMTPAFRAAKALASLPSSIRVGPFDFAIETMPALASGSKWGEFNSLTQVINLAPEFPTAMKVVDTTLHELVHAIFWVTGLGDGEKEEHVVGHIGRSLAQVHRDNPWLAGWIAEHAR